MVALHFTDGYDSGWFGYSGWLKRVILRREFSLFKEPRFISREDAKLIRAADTMYGLGAEIILWELVKSQNLLSPH